MNPKFHKTLIAGAIAALIASPALFAEEESMYPEDTPYSEEAPYTEEMPQTEAERRMGAEPHDSTTDAPPSDNPLLSLTPEELRGVDVLDIDGEKVGEVKAVLRDPEGEDIHLVVSSGGFLGIGASEILVSLDEVRLLGEDELQIHTSKEALEARGETSQEGYIELEGNQPIGELPKS